MAAHWARRAPPPEIWKAPGSAKADYAAEQDAAAGGRGRRIVRFPDGTTATGSITIKPPQRRNRRIYAYLRYSRAGRTIWKYVGEAKGQRRAEALRAAWRVARKNGLLNPAGDLE